MKTNRLKQTRYTTSVAQNICQSQTKLVEILEKFVQDTWKNHGNQSEESSHRFTKHDWIRLADFILKSAEHFQETNDALQDLFICHLPDESVDLNDAHPEAGSPMSLQILCNMVEKMTQNGKKYDHYFIFGFICFLENLKM